MNVACPRCGAKIDVASGETADDGRIRVPCTGCDAKLLIKVNRPDLKLDGSIPTSNGEELAPLAADRSTSLEALEQFSIDVGSGEYSSGGAGLRVVVVQSLPEEGLDELRRRLIRIPRFRRNPNKIHDATAELPYVLTNLEMEDEEDLEAMVVRLGGACVAGPEWRILDEAGHPKDFDQIDEPVQAEEIFGEADDGLLIMGEADDDEQLVVDDEDDELLLAGDEDDEPLVPGDEDDELLVPGDEDDELLVAGDEALDDLPVAGEADDDAVDEVDDDEPTPAPPSPPPRPKEPSGLGALGRPVLPERPRRASGPIAAPPPQFAPIELAAADEDDALDAVSDDVGADDDGIELAPETYDDLVAVVTSDHMPSMELPFDDPVRLVTAESMPGQGEPLGVVSVTLEIPPTAAARSRADLVAEAIRDSETALQDKARALGANLIVAIRTTASDLVDGTLLVVMQGTATRDRAEF